LTVKSCPVRAFSGGSSYFRDIQFTPEPEPSTGLLVSLGLAGLTGSVARRRAA